MYLWCVTVFHWASLSNLYLCGYCITCRGYHYRDKGTEVQGESLEDKLHSDGWIGKGLGEEVASGTARELACPWPKARCRDKEQGEKERAGAWSGL